MLRTEQLFNHLRVSEDGSLILNNERAILVSMSAFGTLRQDLIQNLGYERMKGFLIRYGWDLGVNDAAKVLELHLSSIAEMIKKGPTLHTMRGHVEIELTYLDIDTEAVGPIISIDMEGIWKNSYEAVEHVERNGITTEGGCHTLAGYVSGYLSAICNQKVIAIEISCIGKGDRECRWVAKSIDRWGKSIENELAYYRQTPIVEELEITYEQLLEERNNLQIAATIQKKLTKELINGKDLTSIAQVIHQITKLPIIFEDAQYRIITYAGINESQLNELQQNEPRQTEKKLMKLNHQPACNLVSNVAMIDCRTYYRMMNPIFLQGRVHGYCSFLYFEKNKAETSRTAIEQMIIERIAEIVSFYLLNEKTAFEAAQRAKGHFFEEILNGKFTSKNDILQKGHLINFDFEKPYFIVVLKYETSSKSIARNLRFMEELMKETLTYAQNKRINILVGQHLGNPVLLIEGEKLNEQQIEKICWEFHAYLAKVYVNVTFCFGISLKALDIMKVTKHYEEAKQALRMTSTNSQVITFQSLGIVGVLINKHNLSAIKEIAIAYLGPLYKCDDEKQRELLRTLYMFIFYGGNLEKTATKLTISISGLRYRIQKIEETLGHDLRNPTTNYQLFLILQALMLLGELVV